MTDPLLLLTAAFIACAATTTVLWVWHALGLTP
jgi:hypothetical protein